MFKVTNANGFHITFDNGATVSVQWENGNYCGKRDLTGRQSDYSREDSLVEIAAWYENGDYINIGSDDQIVLGWQNANKVLATMNKVAAMPKNGILLLTNESK